jgi:hypothetical protein
MMKDIGTPPGNLWESVPVPMTYPVREFGPAGGEFSLINFAV